MPSRVTNVDHLECSACGRTYEVALRNVCPECARPLLARYDLEGLRREDLLPRKDLWRYLPVLPLGSLEHVLPLGEGGSPLLRCPSLERTVGIRELYVKDEGLNPTGTFKARGMAVAVPMARSLGATTLVVPTTGNAGAALAAYAATYGVEGIVLMAMDGPDGAAEAVGRFNADLLWVEGDLAVAGRIAREVAQ